MKNQIASFDQKPRPCTGSLSQPMSAGVHLRNTGPLVDPRFRAMPNQATPRVLVIDDESGVRELLHSVLSDNFECDRAASGEEGIELAIANSYDVVLSDILMPGCSGMDVLARLQQACPSTAVILVTAVQDTQQAIEALRLGAFDFILKPFDIEEVELCVRRALRHKELLDENRFYQTRLESLVVERTSDLQDRNEELEARLLDTSLSFRSTLTVLTAALEARDVEAKGHTSQVVAFALRLGEEMGLDEDQMESLEYGALLHDIGTIYIPDAILNKPGRLDPEEWFEVQRHTYYGARLLREIGMLAKAAPIVEQHHERWDGTGYPRGMRGNKIDLGARIFAVADCMEAMTSGRPYRAAKSFGEVAEELHKCAGNHFDPAVVEAFFAISIPEWESIREGAIRRSMAFA